MRGTDAGCPARWTASSQAGQARCAPPTWPGRPASVRAVPRQIGRDCSKDLERLDDVRLPAPVRADEDVERTEREVGLFGTEREKSLEAELSDESPRAFRSQAHHASKRYGTRGSRGKSPCGASLRNPRLCRPTVARGGDARSRDLRDLSLVASRRPLRERGIPRPRRTSPDLRRIDRLTEGDGDGD